MVTPDWNKLAKEVLELVCESEYHDLSEYIYDDCKFLKVRLTRHESPENALHDLWLDLDNGIDIIDLNGGLEKVKNKLAPYFGLKYRDEATGKWVMTERFLRERGFCCSIKRGDDKICRHCPYRDKSDVNVTCGDRLPNDQPDQR